VDENLGWIGRVHRRTDVALGYGLHPQEAAVVRGMVLGDRSLIPEDLEEAFQKSGITHATSTSGSWPSVVETRSTKGRDPAKLGPRPSCCTYLGVRRAILLFAGKVYHTD
jgi:Competence protein